MKKKNLRKVAACFCLLMLTISLTGCGGNKPSADTDKKNATSKSEDNKTTGDKSDKAWPANSVTFSTTHAYSKLLKLNLVLPDGVTASDLTDITFTLDTDKPLELRLYAGATDVQKSVSHELTGETVVAEATADGTEKADVDGKSVDQENYALNLNKQNVTRFYLSEGEGQSLAFKVDERATGILSAIQGNSVMLGIYANNMAPEFTIYNVSFKAGGKDYTVTLDENTAKPTQGSSLQFH